MLCRILRVEKPYDFGLKNIRKTMLSAIHVKLFTFCIYFLFFYTFFFAFIQLIFFYKFFISHFFLKIALKKTPNLLALIGFGGSIYFVEAFLYAINFFGQC